MQRGTDTLESHLIVAHTSFDFCYNYDRNLAGLFRLSCDINFVRCIHVKHIQLLLLWLLLQKFILTQSSIPKDSYCLNVIYICALANSSHDETNIVKFNVLLTVHHAMILGNCPTWRSNSFQCIYLL